MSFLSAREHGAKPGSGGVASAQQDVRMALPEERAVLPPDLTHPFFIAVDRQKRTPAEARTGDHRPGEGPLLHAQPFGADRVSPLPHHPPK